MARDVTRSSSSVSVEAGGVPASDVTGGVGGGAVARVGRVGRIRVARAARVGRVARAAPGPRISKMFVTTVQGLALSVVRGPVALEEAALQINRRSVKLQ